MIRHFKSSYYVWLKSLLAILLLVLVSRLVNLKEVMQGALRLSPLILVGTLFLSILIRWVLSLQLGVAMNAHGARYRVGTLLSITMRTQFFGLVLPGDASNMGLKWYLLGRVQGQRSQALVTLVYLRLVAICVILGSGTLAFTLTLSEGAPVYRWAAVALIFVLLLLMGLLHLGYISRLLEGISRSKGWMKMPPFFRRHGFKLIEASRAIAMLCPKAIAGIWLLQLAVKLLAAMLCWMVGNGLGLQLGFLEYLWLHSALELAEWVPLTPSGLGTREVTLVYLMGKIGVAAEAALAFSLCMFTVRVLTGLCGGLFLLGGAQKPSSGSSLPD